MKDYNIILTKMYEYCKTTRSCIIAGKSSPDGTTFDGIDVTMPGNDDITTCILTLDCEYYKYTFKSIYHIMTTYMSTLEKVYFDDNLTDKIENCIINLPTPEDIDTLLSDDWTCDMIDDIINRIVTNTLDPVIKLIDEKFMKDGLPN